MRVQANIPIILMGEAGIGKTSLIKVFKEISNGHLYIMCIHAGVLIKEIIEFIDKSIHTSIAEPNVILFFDEINTNKLIGGFFKELLIERRIQGRLIPENIHFIAACNPFKLKARRSKDEYSGNIQRIGRNE